MQRRSLRFWTRVSFSILACCFSIGARAEDGPGFKVHLLNAESEFSAATAIDINQDGKVDIVCGAWWYEAPHWTKHRFREVPQIRGRFDDYSNLAMDVDRDGLKDIVSANYRSNSLYWCRNPGIDKNGKPLPEPWSMQIIDRPGASETGRLVDIDGDGHIDVLPNGLKFAAWYEAKIPDSAAANATSSVTVDWQRHDLPSELNGHGIGAGDLNNDGRTDVIGPNGWAEGPSDPRNGRWTWHPEFQLAKDCGLPILVADVDQDGDNDLIWGRGHNVGLYWTEQRSPESEAWSFDESIDADNSDLQAVHPSLLPGRWVTHAIDTSFSCAHTLMLADIDQDGRDDLVVGKRFQGHDGRDPGENDPLTVRWYKMPTPETPTWTSHIISSGGKCAIDLDSVCTDLDGDGDVDILAPSRGGLHWIENLGSISPLPETTSVSNNSNQAELQQVIGDNQLQTTAALLELGQRREDIRRSMELVMGPLPTAQSRIPLDVQVEQVTRLEKYTRIKLTYTSDRTSRVPAYLLVPHAIAEPAPAMLCLHPTQFELGKAQICGMGGKPSRFYAHELASRGFVCLAPDYPSFAEYSFDFDTANPPYVSGSMKAIWDNIRGVDLLENLPCVSRDQIGVIGHSLGGHNALFTAVFDQRLRATVTSCGFTAFADYYGGNLKGWTTPRYMPRIQTVYEGQPDKLPFDFTEVLEAIAPRPLFVSAPKADSNFEVKGVHTCEDAVTPVYQFLQAEDNLHFQYPDCEHDFPEDVREQVYQWLEKALKK
ncbi:FG-GAP repeat protein [Roseimaritima multifibrata]|uniref:FG-GAP repeat protein n=1 Tax=Roseimaritima multifibrata TaxID=1930274 RepID=A0A517MKB6_9BACT|nr:alpha/beta fold hydrolase [Roseimaritima multifibrata]QDS95323.1 FG-GAP repeat protein [Roseimaritima multifibrata]